MCVQLQVPLRKAPAAHVEYYCPAPIPHPQVWWMVSCLLSLGKPGHPKSRTFPPCHRAVLLRVPVKPSRTAEDWSGMWNSHPQEKAWRSWNLTINTFLGEGWIPGERGIELGRRGEKCQRAICLSVLLLMDISIASKVWLLETESQLTFLYSFFLVDISFHFFWNSWITRQVNTDKKCHFWVLYSENSLLARLPVDYKGC